MGNFRFGLYCLCIGALAAASAGTRLVLRVPVAAAAEMGSMGGHMEMTALPMGNFRFGLYCLCIGALAAASAGTRLVLRVPVAAAAEMGSMGGHMEMTALPMGNFRFGLYCLCIGALAAASAGTRLVLRVPVAAAAEMGSMGGHMEMTALRPLQPGDRQRADAVAEAAKTAMAPYADYHKALADGYHIFLPNLPQRIYHFTNSANGIEAAFHFNPLKPTSLLYKKTADGGYRLVGAMYTAPAGTTEDELNSRIPLSIARWHLHMNFCRAPRGELAAYFGPNAKFGLLGSITTKEACEAAGGSFRPHVFGWMVHVYPLQTDASKIWSVDDDDEGHDNMDHSAMPGMNVN